ncbi:MAG: HlyD family efflux transporter periplasmic adaptor subunit [Alphaproteobacteria bacterium]
MTDQDTQKVKKPGRIRRIVLPIVVLALAILGARVLVATGPKATPSIPSEKAWAVSAVPVVVQDVQPKIQAFGTVSAGRDVDLRVLVTGPIVKKALELKEGGRVKKGQALVSIDAFNYEVTLRDRSAQLDEARARLDEVRARVSSSMVAKDQAEQQLQLRRRDLDRAYQLYQRGTVSQKYVDDRALAVSSAEQAAEQARSDAVAQDARLAQQAAAIDRLESAVAKARRDLTDTVLYSPFDAIVSNVTAELGKNVSPNERIATLQGVAGLEVKVTLSDQQFGRLISDDGALTPGVSEFKVTWRIGNSDIATVAVFDRFGPRIASARGGVEVIARIDDDPNDSLIRPGAFVEVELPDRRFRDVVRVPVDSVYENRRIYVVNDEKRLTERRIEIVGAAGQDLLVRGDLKVGDMIATTRLARVGEGVLVDVRRVADANLADQLIIN